MSDEIADVLRETWSSSRRIAVLGIKTEAQSGTPAYYVPQYMQAQGFEIVPVPVYFPEATEILGQKVFRALRDVSPPVDMVNVFRRAQDLAPHLEDILAAKPKSVWLQLGIRDDAFAEKLRQAGIKVVQDRCLMVEHRMRSR